MMKHLALLLLLSLAAVKDGSAESALRAKTPSYSASHQRRELGVTDWWYTLLNHLHVPCPLHHTEDRPLGHCAHHSHTPHHKKSSGGSSGGSSGESSGGSSGGSTYYCSYTCEGDSTDCTKCEDVCQEDSCDGSSSYCLKCDDIPTCSEDCDEDDESCVACSSGWKPDGWASDGWGSSSGGSSWKASYSRNKGEGASSKSKVAFWGIGAGLCALVAAAALFMTRKKNGSDDRDVPRDVYMAEDDEDYYANSVQSEQPRAESKTSRVKNWFRFGRSSSRREGALV